VPLIGAAIFDNVEVVKFLVTKLGADVEDKKGNGKTALIITALNGHLDMIRYLVELRADVKHHAKTHGETCTLA
jgi:ankyrin repeat protein